MDYILDVHTHTIVSGHAYSTMQEVVEQAAKKGLELVAITDHAPAMPGSAHMFYFSNLGVLPQYIDGVEVLKGIEANIINYNGDIDVSEVILKQLDIVIASLHPPCIDFGNIEENTNAIIGAMKNPYVNIIGHPDDARYPLDYDKIVKAAKEHNVLLEVNNSSMNPNGFRKGADKIKIMLEKCMKENVPVVINSDAHVSFDVGNFDSAIKLIEEINFPKELIVNTSTEKLKRFLKG
ncbi:phosphatase [Vallitalea maricola]|uniref:Phosphatase n=1 Tax=Vallitalea maricola TaxID=3074433 RepID=A0ACB5UGJ9_9FIRM|nr:phosphatase [Vallitalea sp. AN17-2]